MLNTALNSHTNGKWRIFIDHQHTLIILSVYAYVHTQKIIMHVNVDNFLHISAISQKSFKITQEPVTCKVTLSLQICNKLV